MKQILPKLKAIFKHLSFVKKAFTKGGFRHVTQYINGLITLNKKTIKKISEASVEEKHHSALNRVLSESKFKQTELEDRYLKKIDYLTRGYETSLLLDDTLVKREGKKVEETQSHKVHSGDDDYLLGHQFFTSVIYTSVLQLPLFPILYSKNTDSKIQMALDLFDRVNLKVDLDTVIMDSWYSDKKLINKIITKKVKVVCAIKTNRSISMKEGEWEPLLDFSKKVKGKEFAVTYANNKKYKTANFTPKLKGIPKVKMIISYEWNKKQKQWNGPRHFISTKIQDTSEKIIREYSIRWFIETFHRDIKQNLGFAKTYLRKKEGIVRHAIFTTLAYAILKLFMFFRGINITVGECCNHIQNIGMDDFLMEIVEIEDKNTRIKRFQEEFISKTAKL
tara:strand:+ start:90 stop:1265 length:1176 start_codon:yes stop_codon:yes gene_type:complete